MTTKLDLMKEMKFFLNVFLLLTCIFSFSACVRLNPLENNDKLQSINSRYIAEWQWESWSMKPNMSQKEIISPGPRINAALWKDTTGQNWYLFGGQPINPDSEKIYSDVWKYSVVSRLWERMFPFINSQENKGRHTGKIDGMVSLRVNFFDRHNKRQKQENNNIVLCGRSSKRNVTNTKKNFWNYFSHRKSDADKNVDESKSLAVYGPRTSKSNTVWQIDLKDKLWTHYVCCCDTSNYEKGDPSPKNSTLETSLLNHTKEDIPTSIRQNQTSINIKIDKTEDEIDLRQEHMTVSPSVTKKKKINQMKKNNRRKKEHKTDDVSHNQNHSLIVAESVEHYSKYWIPESQKKFSLEDGFVSKKRRDVKNDTKHVDELVHFSQENKTERVREEVHDRGNLTENGKVQSKLVSKYCPDFTSDEEPVSWCDGNNDALITTDLSTSQIILWIFDLKTSHWSQQPVDVAEGTQWPGCSNTSVIRYAGSGEEIYILCSGLEYENSFWDNSTLNVSETVQKPQELDNSYKSVFRISWKRLILESLGKINLEKFFKQSDHKEMWKNESRTVVQVIRLSDNETIMLLAYKESVDLWMLLANDTRGYYFEPVENIWRGSAQKWFNKYNAANYNFRFVSEKGNSETTLILNPRVIPYSEYWPRERGRFIIRMLKNENLRNHSFVNQSREHNLTYDLLQSDINSPSIDVVFAHSYNVKVLIFFGISLAIFTTFGVIIFLKKCVNCPSRNFLQNDCQKSPPVIRYSVMHDDILYPAA